MDRSPGGEGPYIYQGSRPYPGGGRRAPRRRAPSGSRLVALLVIAALVASAAWVLLRDGDRDGSVPLVVLGMAGPDGRPQRLAGAVVTGPTGEAATADEHGTVTLVFTPPASVAVAAAGYQAAVFQITTVPEGGPIGLQLAPVVLTGRVVDAAGNGLSAAVSSGEQRVATDATGGFQLLGVLPGPVAATRPAWMPAEAEWDGSAGRLDIVMQPRIVRGVRVYGPVAASSAEFSRLLDMIEGTVINALVFDTKEESGRVFYDSQVPAARDIGAIGGTYQVAGALEEARRRGYYTITRIVTFQDPIWAPANPEHAIRNTATGGLWLNHRGLAWADPTDRQAWEYPLALAVEACQLGFDEIQFDYIRFPSDGDLSVVGYDQAVNEETRVATIAAFLSEARERLHAEGCAVSADIFGIVLSFPNDQGIGQRLEEMAASVDALSPMIYPSHYSAGWLGLADPNAHPSAVVGNALGAGVTRVKGALIRPWLQAFFYDAGQIAEQTEQAEDRGLGWLLWNATSRFEADWFPTR